MNMEVVAANKVMAREPYVMDMDKGPLLQLRKMCMKNVLKSYLKRNSQHDGLAHDGVRHVPMRCCHDTPDRVDAFRE
jgi:hypothetical protein